VVWAAFAEIAARYDDAEQDDLFSGTARRTYRL
jgi:predicted TIM-barrel fold metal-dependent hydrolase